MISSWSSQTSDKPIFSETLLHCSRILRHTCMACMPRTGPHLFFSITIPTVMMCVTESPASLWPCFQTLHVVYFSTVCYKQNMDTLLHFRHPIFIRLTAIIGNFMYTLNFLMYFTCMEQYFKCIQ